MENTVDNNNRGLSTITILLIVLLVLILGGGIWYWYANKSTKNTTPTTTTTPTTPKTTPTTETTPTTTTTDETADWKTYEDAINKYSVKYPKNWDYKKISEKRVEFREIGKTYQVEGSDTSAIDINISDNKDNKTSLALANARNKYNGTVKELTVGGVTSAQLNDYLGIETFVAKGNKVYNISTPVIGTEDQEIIQDIYKKMLSTFQFTP